MGQYLGTSRQPPSPWNDRCRHGIRPPESVHPHVRRACAVGGYLVHICRPRTPGLSESRILVDQPYPIASIGAAAPILPFANVRPYLGRRPAVRGTVRRRAERHLWGHMAVHGECIVPPLDPTFARGSSEPARR